MHIDVFQSSSSSSSSSSSFLEDLLKEQFAPLEDQLSHIFHHYAIDFHPQEHFKRLLRNEFQDIFSAEVPSSLKQRAIDEQQLIRSIQLQLQRQHLILRRTADNMNTFYLGDYDDFQHRSNDFVESSGWFDFLGTIDNEIYPEQQQYLLKSLLSSMNVELENLTKDRLLTFADEDKLKVNFDRHYQLPYLYFLPRVNSHDNNLESVQPRFSLSMNFPLQPIAIYLDQMLRPAFEKCTQSTTCMNGGEFVEQLQSYTQQEYAFTKCTSFVVFEIHHLSTRVSHADILHALNHFLTYHYYHRVEKQQQPRLTTVATTSNYLIMQLTQFYLENNLFTYENKLYRLTKGVTMTCMLARLLLDIYLFYWQKPISKLAYDGEHFFRRYRHQFFFTWDAPKDRVRQLIMQLNEQYPDIQLTVSIGKHVQFHNIDIENNHGQLEIRVYHPRTQQYFLLPYPTKQNDSPRLFYRQWFRFALIQAAHYCTNVDDFHHERRRLISTFLVNGYSLDFVERQQRKFFQSFNSNTTIDNILQINTSTYRTFRYQLRTCLNAYRQNYENEQRIVQQQQQLIHCYYLFDWGLRYQFNRRFWKLWLEIIDPELKSREKTLKIKLNTKHCYRSNDLFNLKYD
ncbi:unnamed protein product [Adineta ricciae]|nr:unnamed protein product [Adineta ricciae]